MEHYRKLERMYLAAPINAFFKPRLHIEEGWAEVRIEVRPDFHHTLGAMHGAVYFKAMDDAGFFAVNSRVEDVFVLTTTFTTYFTRPIAEGEMIAEGKIVFEGRSQFIAEVVVYNSDRQEIGRGSGTYVRGRTKLSEDIGYK